MTYFIVCGFVPSVVTVGTTVPGDTTAVLVIWPPVTDVICGAVHVGGIAGNHVSDTVVCTVLVSGTNLGAGAVVPGGSTSYWLVAVALPVTAVSAHTWAIIAVLNATTQNAPPVGVGVDIFRI